MAKIKRIILIFIFLSQVSSACAPTAVELRATGTQVAADLFGTQTVQAPPVTPTETPVSAEIEESISASTDFETLPPVTATPWAIKELPSGAEDELLCYQAAVLVYVDWAVHDILLHPYRPKNNLYGMREESINNINRLNWYRNQRQLRITEDKGDPTIINDLTYYLNRTYYLNGEELSHCEKIEDVIFSRSSLGYHPWLPEGYGPTKSPPPPGQSNERAEATIQTAMNAIERTVRSMRYQLLVNQGIDYQILMEVERSVWEDARTAFGIDLPRYLQGQEMTQ